MANFLPHWTHFTDLWLARMSFVSKHPRLYWRSIWKRLKKQMWLTLISLQNIANTAMKQAIHFFLCNPIQPLPAAVNIICEVRTRFASSVEKWQRPSFSHTLTDFLKGVIRNLGKASIIVLHTLNRFMIIGGHQTWHMLEVKRGAQPVA